MSENNGKAFDEVKAVEKILEVFRHRGMTPPDSLLFELVNVVRELQPSTTAADNGMARRITEHYAAEALERNKHLTKHRLKAEAEEKRRRAALNNGR